jgi:hypothetical protein
MHLPIPASHRIASHPHGPHPPEVDDACQAEQAPVPSGFPSQPQVGLDQRIAEPTRARARRWLAAIPSRPEKNKPDRGGDVPSQRVVCLRPSSCFFRSFPVARWVGDRSPRWSDGHGRSLGKSSSGHASCVRYRGEPVYHWWVKTVSCVDNWPLAPVPERVRSL